MKLQNLFAGIIVGAVVGAGIMLLLAPNSGEETRREIQERVETAIAEGKATAEARRSELLADLELRKQGMRPIKPATV